MATPTPGTVTASAGSATLYVGRSAPNVDGTFSSVTLLSSDSVAPYNTADQTLLLDLHGSGTPETTVGLHYEAICDSLLTYDTNNNFRWAAYHGYKDANNKDTTVVHPWDRQTDRPSGITIRQSFWMGWIDNGAGVPANANTGKLCLYTERRLDLMLDYMAATQPNLSATKWAIQGGSMGAIGALTYGIRRPNRFAALYPSRPRWRYYDGTGKAEVPDWLTATQLHGSADPVALWDRSTEGGNSWTHQDVLGYVSNSANPIPWIGWCVGRNDGYTPFTDHVDAVAALRARGAGFAFAWNNGDHSGGEIISQITASYVPGIFEVGKGYPVFTEHSLDQDPSVDLVGGINLNLKFRNVTESSGSWSCQVTNISAACTVNVKPKSSIYTGNPTPQLVTIPAANTWVTVSF